MMDFTGERFVPTESGDIELEHMHRYLLAKELAADKSVLDIACGEGYGSALLATVAKNVIGVDISEQTIEHAANKYKTNNLEYRHGSCTLIPLADACIDMVVSFETIEHHAEHDLMMREIKRVLKPDGVLMISSPDRQNYSIDRNYSNEFHVLELFSGEFKALLSKYFENSSFYLQKIIYGSAILPESARSACVSFFKEKDKVIGVGGVNKPLYWIAIASSSRLPNMPAGLYEVPLIDAGPVRSLNKASSARDQLIAEHERVAIDRDNAITALNEVVSARDQLIAEHERVAIDRDNEITALNEVVSARDQLIKQMSSSWSWRITRPLRCLLGFISKI